MQQYEIIEAFNILRALVEIERPSTKKNRAGPTTCSYCGWSDRHEFKWQHECPVSRAVRLLKETDKK